MDFALSEDQEMLRQTVRDFAQEVVKPKAAEIDETGVFPLDTIQKAAELGLMGVAVPDEYGGAGMDYLCYAIAIEEISRVCATTGVILSVNNSLVCDPLAKFANEEQKKRILTPLASGEKIGCLGLTEAGAGTDAAAISTTAVKDKDGYVLNGAKLFITNGGVADWALVTAQMDKSKRHKGIACFAVEKGTPGFNVGKEEKKLGIHASSCTELLFEDCRVPAENRLGEEGQGFKVAMYTLDGGRIGIASQALGIAQGALDEAVPYAQQRVQFGKPIAEFQAIQWMLAEMKTQIEAARNLVYKAAWAKQNQPRCSVESAIAKLYAARAATEVTHAAIQILGGYGYTKDFPVERFYRDARITEIYEGTNEVQKMVIAADLLR
ncbi:MAG: acyl-CoA dehydrogenase [Planctomycetota bacterium]|jgi:alkylation response protein AidB-like acyl-CoA dehydrogenase